MLPTIIGAPRLQLLLLLPFVGGGGGGAAAGDGVAAAAAAAACRSAGFSLRRRFGSARCTLVSCRFIIVLVRTSLVLLLLELVIEPLVRRWSLPP